jgi:hypothetical protein
VSEPIAIPHAPWALWQEMLAHYDYAQDPLHCPICGGVGWVWRGWFSCDGRCHSIALVATGQVYLPIPLPKTGHTPPP